MSGGDAGADPSIATPDATVGPPRRRLDLLSAALALVAGGVVLWLSVDLFPYHSVNDDEGVYLQQAALLLDGQLQLYPGTLAEAVRPWFFVVADAPEPAGGVRMYPKYSPVAAAMFAAGKLLTGSYRVALGVVAAGNAWLVYRLTTAAFDRRTGVVAVAVLVASPLFLLTSSVFLSYAPTTLLSLSFALGYVRAARADTRGRDRRALGWGVGAGVAIGLAFFSRPYTAVLFAIPFLGHAAYSLAVARQRAVLRPTLARYLAIGGPGVLGVAVALGYNAVLTGDPLLFPYEVFAPRDGIGFGHRELLGYSETYTPALAAATTARVLAILATDWLAAGPVGTALAAVGLGVVLHEAGVGDATATRRRRGPVAGAGALVGVPPGCSPRALRLVLAGLLPAVILGNAYFWGALNGLRNGLIGLLGPFYHFDLLLPLSAFAAAGLLAIAARLRKALAGRLDPRQVRGVAVVVLVLVLVGGGLAEAAVLADPVSANRERTETLEATYHPIEAADFDRAVVFVPTPYGDWLNHPFQYLRNEPGFDGDVVYVLDGDPARDAAMLATLANRTPYRFTYRGTWQAAETGVTPLLQELSVRAGDRVDATTTAGAPAEATSAHVRLETAEGYARYEVGTVGDEVRVDWTLSAAGVRVTNHPAATGADAVALPAGASEVRLLVTFVTESGASITYRQELTVVRDDGRIRVVWPPETRVCRLTTDCGREGTWVGGKGEYVTGISLATNATASGGSG